MKETGVIRRLDELGRIVIPKEIRKNLHINEGDMIEIYLEGPRTMVLRKHSPFKILEDDSFQLAKTLYDKYKNTVLITNTDQVISGYGNDYGNYVDKYLTNGFARLISANESYYGLIPEIVPHQNNPLPIMAIQLKGKDEKNYGAICMFEDKNKIDNSCQQILQFIASYFAKRLEL